MHGSVMRWLSEVIKPDMVKGKTVLELGSCDVNGTPRSIIEPFGPAQYVGIDQRHGPGVDQILNVSDLADWPSEQWDFVVSTEMLEHCLGWRGAVNNMKRLLKPGGVLLITCRGPGMTYHPEEGLYGDFWRFTTTDFERIFVDFPLRILMQDPELPGVLFLGFKPAAMPDLRQIEVAKSL